MAVLSVVAALLAPPSAEQASGLDRERSLKQYDVDTWTSARGYGGGIVYAITQTTDGYLWIAGERGLLRFDGSTFSTLEVPGPPAKGNSANVLGVTAGDDRAVWVRLPGPALLTLRDGTAENQFLRFALQPALVTAMTAGRDGSVLLASSRLGLLRYHHGRLSTLVVPRAMPRSIVIALAESGDGRLWLGTRDAGVFQAEQGRVTPVPVRLRDPKVNCLLPGPEGDVWIGTDSEVAHWIDGTLVSLALPAQAAGARALAMIRDRDQNLWIAAGRHGLVRVDGAGHVEAADWDHRSRGQVTAVFEDREGNLWLGTTRGIERWREGPFTSTWAPESLPVDRLGALHVDQSGGVWLAAADGGLSWMRGDDLRAVTAAGLNRDIVYSIAGRGGEIWIGRQRHGLTRLRRTAEGWSERTFTTHDALAQNSVYAVHVARDGAVWAGTLSGGVSRYHDDRFTTYTKASGLASNTVTALADDGDDSVWVGTPDGVSRWSAGSWHTFTADDGLPANEIRTLLAGSHGRLWIGSTAGLSFIRGGRVVTPVLPPPLRNAVIGLAEDRFGWLWIATASRLMRVQVAALVGGQLKADDVSEFDLADGLVSQEGIDRHRSVVSDGRGRIWFAMNRGLSMVDPARLSLPRPAALVRVESVVADDTAVAAPDAGTLPVPPGTHRLTVNYVGLSLAVPERVRFRYRLDGVDRDWSAPVTTRQATYVNVAPGSYRFSVLASDSQGRWTTSPAAVTLEVTPLPWQTRPFQAGVMVAAACVAWSIYRLRVRQVKRGLNARFEERLSERTRIAQELHDTLLQGFISASMRLHVVVDAIVDDTPMRDQLGQVMLLMRRVVNEGRNAVRGLRAPEAGDDLERAFAQVLREHRVGDTPEHRVLVEGPPRVLHPLVRDEIYRIGCEALINALRHAHATRIETVIEYGKRHIRIVVRDDGRGMEAPVLRGGRQGHWGLAGMRERALRIGAALEIQSHPGGGTEVALSIPTALALAGRRVRARRTWRDWMRNASALVPRNVRRPS